jgi:chaperonin GroES
MTRKSAAAKVLKVEPSPAAYLQENFDALVDFVLIVPIEKPLSESAPELQQSEHFKEKPTWGIVAAVGSGRVVNGILIPIDVAPGDEVYFTKYGEEVELDGRKAQLVHAAEVKVRRRKPGSGVHVAGSGVIH